MNFSTRITQFGQKLIALSTIYALLILFGKSVEFIKIKGSGIRQSRSIILVDK